jgi:uncharacterized protein
VVDSRALRTKPLSGKASAFAKATADGSDFAKASTFAKASDFAKATSDKTADETAHRRHRLESPRISARSARRIALAAQGLARGRPPRVSKRHLAALLKRLSLLQIDSVNVLVRAHYMPLFSRLGPYPTKWIDEAAYNPRKRQLFEYWGHEASLISLPLLPLFGWRMREAAAGIDIYSGLKRFAAENPAFVERVLEHVLEIGPAGAGEIESHLKAENERKRKTGGWWGWSETKAAVEWLFWTGALTTFTRRNFERIYDATNRVFPDFDPAAVKAVEAIRQLVLLAAQALGVATAADLRDYFRLPAKAFPTAVKELVDAGQLLEVSVEGWAQPAYLDPDATTPRKVACNALVSPFDPLIWSRQRTERLFGFRYRIEIYTPAQKREHGYYVLPFLLGEDFVARVDLKADRAAGSLLVQGAHREGAQSVEAIIPALSDELRSMAGWLGLNGIRVAPKGDLATALRAALE